MELPKQKILIEQILTAIAKRLPAYLTNPDDLQIANGNVAVCIIDGEGNIHGKMFGKNKIKQREIFGVAWKKASQVWITGIATGRYEKMVYAGEIDPGPFGIMHPEFIGWEGGQPIALDHETRIAVGCSGMRGVNDLEIVSKAAEEVLAKR